mmetsp:Transcript_40735/g.125788  ORF Transcript_40735/g.125788 Transcript_40735/m.125788 type:complete len:241 (+) Transcript_40735:386-1108(+)
MNPTRVQHRRHPGLHRRRLTSLTSHKVHMYTTQVISRQRNGGLHRLCLAWMMKSSSCCNPLPRPSMVHGRHPVGDFWRRANVACQTLSAMPSSTLERLKFKMKSPARVNRLHRRKRRFGKDCTSHSTRLHSPGNAWEARKKHRRTIFQMLCVTRSAIVSRWMRPQWRIAEIPLQQPAATTIRCPNPSNQLANGRTLASATQRESAQSRLRTRRSRCDFCAAERLQRKPCARNTPHSYRHL